MTVFAKELPVATITPKPKPGGMLATTLAQLDTAFDQLALDAEQMGDKELVLEQLGTLMQNCVGCHAGYRIDPVTKM